MNPDIDPMLHLTVIKQFGPKMKLNSVYLFLRDKIIACETLVNPYYRFKNTCVLRKKNIA